MLIFITLPNTLTQVIARFNREFKLNLPFMLIIFLLKKIRSHSISFQYLLILFVFASCELS